MRLFVDIETLPTDRPDIIADISTGITPPANISKPETIAKWESEKKPEAVAEAVHKTGLSGAFGRVCVIAFAFDDGKTFAVHGDDESAVVGGFAAALTEKKHRVVGHNVQFDIRFIWQRAMILGLDLPSWWPVRAKPWDSASLYDTMTEFAGVGQRISLDKLCKAFGLEGKGDIDGSKVAQAWADGRKQEVIDYCAQDVERVRKLYKLMER